MKLRELPARATLGAYVLHTGIGKWKGDEATAKYIHGMAAGAYPFLGKIQPKRFFKLLALGEIATGTALIVPIVPTAVAGALLTGFSGALLGMYVRTPAMHQPGSIWPTQQGTAVSKDSWLFATGVGMLADAWATHRDQNRQVAT